MSRNIQVSDRDMEWLEIRYLAATIEEAIQVRGKLFEQKHIEAYEHFKAARNEMMDAYHAMEDVFAPPQKWTGCQE